MPEYWAGSAAKKGLVQPITITQNPCLFCARQSRTLIKRSSPFSGSEDLSLASLEFETVATQGKSLCDKAFDLLCVCAIDDN